MSRKDKVLTIRVEPEMADALTAFAETTVGISAAEWVRRWIEDGLTTNQGNPATKLTDALRLERSARILKRMEDALDSTIVAWLKTGSHEYLDGIETLHSAVPHVQLPPDIQKALENRKSSSGTEGK
jgi:hypothetical protein